ncbi:MAG: hypothetical protein LUD68_00510, partial [Rikenellaceae bacterium]|nr:hypothetical protein [Rikenellaceae bacterium]
ILDTFRNIDYANGKPHLIVSHTVKGKGISYMENGAKWHHGVPDDAQRDEALGELDRRSAACKDAQDHKQTPPGSLRTF